MFLHILKLTLFASIWAYPMANAMHESLSIEKDLISKQATDWNAYYRALFLQDKCYSHNDYWSFLLSMSNIITDRILDSFGNRVQYVKEFKELELRFLNREVGKMSNNIQDGILKNTLITYSPQIPCDMIELTKWRQFMTNFQDFTGIHKTISTNLYIQISNCWTYLKEALTSSFELLSSNDRTRLSYLGVEMHNLRSLIAQASESNPNSYPLFIIHAVHKYLTQETSTVFSPDALAIEIEIEKLRTTFVVQIHSPCSRFLEMVQNTYLVVKQFIDGAQLPQHMVEDQDMKHIMDNVELCRSIIQIPDLIEGVVSIALGATGSAAFPGSFAWATSPGEAGPSQMMINDLPFFPQWLLNSRPTGQVAEWMILFLKLCKTGETQSDVSLYPQILKQMQDLEVTEEVSTVISNAAFSNTDPPSLFTEYAQLDTLIRLGSLDEALVKSEIIGVSGNILAAFDTNSLGCTYRELTRFDNFIKKFKNFKNLWWLMDTLFEAHLSLCSVKIHKIIKQFLEQSGFIDQENLTKFSAAIETRREEYDTNHQYMDNYFPEASFILVEQLITSDPPSTKHKEFQTGGNQSESEFLVRARLIEMIEVPCYGINEALRGLSKQVGLMGHLIGIRPYLSVNKDLSESLNLIRFCRTVKFDSNFLTNVANNYVKVSLERLRSRQ